MLRPGQVVWGTYPLPGHLPVHLSLGELGTQRLHLHFTQRTQARRSFPCSCQSASGSIPCLCHMHIFGPCKMCPLAPL
jgi:hypothetical protein